MDIRNSLGSPWSHYLLPVLVNWPELPWDHPSQLLLLPLLGKVLGLKWWVHVMRRHFVNELSEAGYLHQYSETLERLVTTQTMMMRVMMLSMRIHLSCVLVPGWSPTKTVHLYNWLLTAAAGTLTQSSAFQTKYCHKMATLDWDLLDCTDWLDTVTLSDWLVTTS